MSKVCREDVNLCVEVNRIKFAFCPGFFHRFRAVSHNTTTFFLRLQPLVTTVKKLFYKKHVTTVIYSQMKIAILTLALVATANASGYSKTYSRISQFSTEAGPVAQFENWVINKFRRLQSVKHVFNERVLSGTGGATGGATGGDTSAFIATCGEITEGGGAFASCTGSRVYESTMAAITSPSDANCCKDAPFVATCGEITNGGGDFASCTGSRVYDVTKAATTSPDDANCCKDAPFVATCGEITNGGGAFASCTGSRVYDADKAATPVLAGDQEAQCCKDNDVVPTTPITTTPKFSVAHTVALEGVSATEFMADPKIIASFQSTVATTLGLTTDKIINIKAKATRRQLSGRGLAAAGCRYEEQRHGCLCLIVLIVVLVAGSSLCCCFLISCLLTLYFLYSFFFPVNF